MGERDGADGHRGEGKVERVGDQEGGMGEGRLERRFGGGRGKDGEEVAAFGEGGLDAGGC